MKVVMWIGFVVSILVVGGVGFLLGGNGARLYWYVGLFFVQFFVFVIASGAVFMLFIVGWFMFSLEEKQCSDLFWLFVIILIVISVVKLYFLVADYIQLFYGGAIDNLIVVNYVLNGPYVFMFWGVQFVFGLFILVIVLAQPKFAKNGVVVGLMGVFLFIGYAAVRILIVVFGQVAEMMPGQVAAFYGLKLMFAYIFSLMEWLVIFVVMGFVLFGILIGMDYLLGYLVCFMEVKK